MSEKLKLVPIEPTDAMLDRAVAFALNVSIGGKYRWTEYMRDLWARMVDAAPVDAAQAPIARTLDEWHEDYGCAVWFTWQDGEWLGEPSWIGTPNDSDWPGYHTHWTPHPEFPARIDAAPVAPAAVAMTDEREAFEAWWQTTKLGERNEAWQGWKARATHPTK